MPKEKPFRDFLLLVLSHPYLGKDGKAVLRERLEFGKKAILENTKPGDLIAFESPERIYYSQFLEVKRPPEAKREWEKEWERDAERDWGGSGEGIVNFYADLADFARANGRKVASLDTGQWKKIASRRWQESQKGSAFIEASIMHGYRRTKAFMARIQRLKPAMAVMASGHGALAAHSIKPRRSIYFPGVKPVKKRLFLRDQRQEAKEFERLRKARRQKINQQLMAQGKLPKMAARRQQAARRA